MARTDKTSVGARQSDANVIGGLINAAGPQGRHVAVPDSHRMAGLLDCQAGSECTQVVGLLDCWVGPEGCQVVGRFDRQVGPDGRHAVSIQYRSARSDKDRQCIHLM